MKNKKIYIAIGIIFIIIFALTTIALSKKNNKSNNNNNNISTQVSEEEKKGDTEGVAYSDEILVNFSFNIKGITDDLASKIENENDFYLALKRYAYKNALVTANEATVKEYKQEGSIIKIRFQLNNTEETRIIAIINTANNKYEFYYY